MFLQQLVCGLRLHPGKEFLVALDLVWNFCHSYVARLALMGYHSVKEYLSKSPRERERRPPAGCIVDLDTQVRRIWERELRALLG